MRLDKITEQQRNLLQQNAAKMAAGSMPFIRWEAGEFISGGEAITGSQFLAVVDKATAVWLAFLKTGVEEIQRTNLMEQPVPTRPDVHTDRDEWETDYKSRAHDNKKDPLGLTYELPLITADDDARAFVFKASTKAQREAVSRLITRVNSEPELRRPFVTLAKIPPPDGKEGQAPEFEIDEYSDDLNDIPLPGDRLTSRSADEPPKAKPSAPANGRKPAAAKGGSDKPIDDTIPF